MISIQNEKMSTHQKCYETLSQELDACLDYFLSTIDPLKKRMAIKLIEQVFSMYEKGGASSKILQKLDRLPYLMTLEETSESLRKIIEEVQGVDCDTILENSFDDQKKPRKEKSSSEVTTLYKKLAKTLHPDLEKKETQKKIKLQEMQALTNAYENKDIDTLLQIEKKWGEGTPSLAEQICKDEIQNLPKKLKYAPIFEYISLPFFKGLTTMQEIYRDLEREYTLLEQEDL